MSDEPQQILFQMLLRVDSDVAAACRKVRELAYLEGLQPSAVEALATAVSEVARNVIVHGAGGDILLGTFADAQRIGVFAVARDDGPGISNLEDAMRDGFSSRGGLGLGLPSARRLVDEFEISSSSNQGTRVTLKKWRPRTVAVG